MPPVLIQALVNIPVPSEDNCVPCCEPVCRVDVICTSYTGEGELCGFSGYRPTGNTDDASDPDAPWNAGPVWKWRVRTNSGEWRNCLYSTSTGEAQNISGRRYEGAQSFSADDCSQTNTRRRWEQGGPTAFVPNPTCATWTESEESTPQDFRIDLDPNFPRPHEFDADLLQKRIICTGDIVIGGNTFTCSVATAAETLTDPDTILDALLRAEVEPDEEPLCCAYTGAMDTTSPESTGPTSVGNSTAVELELIVADCLPETNYVITLSFANRDLTDPEDPIDLPNTEIQLGITTDALGAYTDTIAIPDPLPLHERCWIASLIQEEEEE